MRLRDMEELIKKVEQWSVERGLNTADPSKQAIAFLCQYLKVSLNNYRR